MLFESPRLLIVLFAFFSLLQTEQGLHSVHHVHHVLCFFTPCGGRMMTDRADSDIRRKSWQTQSLSQIHTHTVAIYTQVFPVWPFYLMLEITHIRTSLLKTQLRLQHWLHFEILVSLNEQLEGL